MIELASIFKSFVHILEERLAESHLEGGFKRLSEDTICFFFAAALLEAGTSAHLIEMEVWHPHFYEKKNWATVDIRVQLSDGPIWIEVKFDKNCSHAKYGYLLNDLCRLALLKDRSAALMLFVAPKGAESILKHLADERETALNLNDLHKNVKKQLKKVVVQDIDATKVLVKRICREEVGDLICLLYQVNLNA